MDVMTDCGLWYIISTLRQSIPRKYIEKLNDCLHIAYSMYSWGFSCSIFFSIRKWSVFNDILNFYCSSKQMKMMKGLTFLSYQFEKTSFFRSYHIVKLSSKKALILRELVNLLNYNFEKNKQEQFCFCSSNFLYNSVVFIFSKWWYCGIYCR